MENVKTITSNGVRQFSKIVVSTWVAGLTPVVQQRGCILSVRLLLFCFSYDAEKQMSAFFRNVVCIALM